MTEKPKPATVYLRQSLDQAGDALAVSRQDAECRAYCAQRGWTVTETFVDNDISATTGKRRPGFEALLASRPRRIVVWHVDRLVRLSRDLERVIDLGVNVYAVHSGHIDLSNPAGRAVAKTITAWAQYEGEHKAERQVAKNRQRAQSGVVLWTRRPFGFERDGHEVRVVEAEAAEIRKAADAVLAGATLTSVAADFNARGLRTTVGGAWTVTAVRRIVSNPRVAGRVVSNGQDYGSHGPVILDPDTFEAVGAILRDPNRKSAPPSVEVKYLLSGMVLCGRDGERMVAQPVHNGMVYKCRQCYLARRRDRVDELVMGVLVERLSRPDALGLLDADVDIDELRARVVQLRERRDGLAVLLADGLLTVDAVRVQATRLTGEIDTLGRQILDATGDNPAAKVAAAENVAAALDQLSLRDVRDIVRTLMTVRILPAGKGVRFDPEQVAIEWRHAGDTP